jgi:putative membrane protein
MQTAIQLGLKSWSLPVPVTIALVLAALFYLRGWFYLRRVFPGAIPIWRAVAFLCGLLSVWIAAASPLAVFDDELLTVHMAQHLLLMTAAPALILLGAPPLPLLHGLPQIFVRGVLGPLLRWPLVQWLGRILTAPVFCWLAAAGVLIGWHLPAAYKLGLESQPWHEIEHASFFAAGLLFWWPVIPPWPTPAPFPRWPTVLYLFLATLPCDALSAFLAFCDRVVYTPYLDVPRRFAISPLQDQAFAGALMWTCVTFVYMIPAVFLTMRLLSAPRADEQGVAPADLCNVAARRLSRAEPR